MIAQNPKHSAGLEQRAANDAARSQATADASPASEDPVRAYLCQVAAIPLLTRQQEIELASKIETNRSRFRGLLLGTDFVLREAIDLLTRVQSGELGFERTVQVAVSDRLEKHQILGRLPHNLRTLRALLKLNQQDYDAAIKTRSAHRRWALWRRLTARRGHAVRLVEELGLRLEHLDPHVEALDEYQLRVRQLLAKVEKVKSGVKGGQSSNTNKNSTNSNRPAAETDIMDILRRVQQTPAGLSRCVRKLRLARCCTGIGMVLYL